jgi:putative nucleotidyltransferase with HDIG domain
LFANSDERQDLKNRLSQTGRLQSFQAELRTRSGDLRVGLFSAEIIEIEGQKRQLTAMSDMTERYDREREWEAIATMASALRTADTRAEMLAIIIDQVMRLVKAQGVVFVMRDPNTNQLVMERGGGEWSTFSGMEMPERMSACHMVISTGQRYLNNDVLAHPDLVCEDMVPGIRAVTGLPVITQNSILGALMVGRSAAFSDAELRTLSAVCDIAASAIQRATLHDQTEQRLQRLAALHNIDLAITAGLDLPMVQSILLAQAAVQLGNDASRILLLSPSSKSLRLLAMQGFRNPLPGRPELPLEDSFAGQVATERRMVSIPDLRKVVSSLDNEALPPGEDFVTYHGVPLIAKGEVKGVLEIFNRAHYRPNGEWLEFLENLADQAAISIYNAELYSFLQRSNFDLEVAYDTTLEGWARALEMRDRETEGHSRRVADRTVQLALVMGIPERDIANVRRGALLHDIGKMMVPDRILFKEGPLDAAEWAIMMQHPESAARLLEPIPFLRNAITIPYCHHERWDGSGYPRHLKGEEIPLAARIFAVVDVFDALLSDRPYRQAWPVDEVIHYICAQSGIQFDPAVVAIFVEQVRAEREANSQVQPVAEM